MSTGKAKVLLVDDDPAFCKICAIILSLEGFEVDIAYEGVTALKMLRKTDYDFFFLDIRMPIMNGIELYKRMTKEYPTLANKVAFITGDIIDGSVKEFLSQVERPYLLKPFNATQLREFLRKVC